MGPRGWDSEFLCVAEEDEGEFSTPSHLASLERRCFLFSGAGWSELQLR